MPASQVHPMSAAPTNQVIPREVVSQWEREAEASMPSRVGFNSPSWRAYAGSPGSGSGLRNATGYCCCCFGWNVCLPVALLHLPFCCCADNGLNSCSLAFTQTICCGWCRSYLCCGEDDEQSYHDWLHRPSTEEELQPHREAYVAKNTAMCASPERMAELERSLADAQGEKATAKVQALNSRRVARAFRVRSTIEYDMALRFLFEC